MKKFLASVTIVLGLSGCSALTATNDANAVACTMTLLESGNFDPAALATLAATTASCQALAASVINSIINGTATQNTKLARAKGILR